MLKLKLWATSKSRTTGKVAIVCFLFTLCVSFLRKRHRPCTLLLRCAAHHSRESFRYKTVSTGNKLPPHQAWLGVGLFSESPHLLMSGRSSAYTSVIKDRTSDRNLQQQPFATKDFCTHRLPPMQETRPPSHMGGRPYRHFRVGVACFDNNKYSSRRSRKDSTQCGRLLGHSAEDQLLRLAMHEF